MKRIELPVSSQRTLLLIDVENMSGSSCPRAATLALVRDALAGSTRLPNDAHVVVSASSSATAAAAGLCWKEARLVWMPGPDGADLALADVALNEDVADRYGRVIIASGDHLFAPVARYLRLQGLTVTVVAVPGSLSRVLANEVDEVLYLAGTAGRAA